MESIKDILHHHKLKGTSARLAILNTIIRSETPLSESDIKEKNHGIDRVTFYRSIKSLLETNIIQGVITQGKTIKYTISNKESNKESAIVFYCIECQRMTDVELCNRASIIPEGYEEKSCHITITGTCKSCKNKSSAS